MTSALTCHNCGTALPANKKFCTSCGTPVAVAGRTPQAAVQKPMVPGKETSLQASLARLGIPVSFNTLVGFFSAFIIGLIVPRILPFIFPFFYPILNAVFQGSPDAFNKFMMTSMTFLSSFLVSFVVALLPRLRSRA